MDLNISKMRERKGNQKFFATKFVEIRLGSKEYLDVQHK
jgi:hypothetical protein